MTMSKQEMQEIARQVQEGRYVSKGTLYVAVVIALALGLYMGNLLTSVYAPAPVSSTSAPQPGQPVQSAQPQEVDPGLAAAILKYEKMTREAPDNADAWAMLGHAYFDSNRPKAAITAYTKALELAPGNPDVLTDLGVMYRRDGQPERAVELFDEAMRLNPAHEQSRFNKGIVLYHDLDRKEEAIAAWEDLLRINPSATAPGGQPLSAMIQQLSR